MNVKLPRTMPNGAETKGHPLNWLIVNMMPKYSDGVPYTVTDLAKTMSIRPQSIYKWRRVSRADRNFLIPALRAKQIAAWFGVHAGYLRPDLYGAVPQPATPKAKAKVEPEGVPA